MSAAPFERVAIVGCGLIGGSLALAWRERWRQGRIIAVDRQPVVDSAIELGAADTGGDDLRLAADADLIVLAAPVRQNIQNLDALVDRVAGDALVTDVGGTKRAIAAAANRLPDRLRFVGGHPLAGAAAGGIHAVRSDLFHGKPWILTPIKRSQPRDVERLSAMVTAFGATPMTMDPIAHDRLMAYVSHLPQLAVSALMQVVGARAGAEGLAIAGSGLRDTTRLASSPAGTWRDVAATNADELSGALGELIVALQKIKNDLTFGDELQRVFDDARNWKRVLDEEP